MKIFQFWGMRRSGNHAIIDWLIKNLSNSDPDFIDGWDVRKYGDLLFLNNYDKSKSHYLNHIRQINPKILLISYEDKYQDYFLVDPSKSTNLIISRSLENVVASRLKKISTDDSGFWEPVMRTDDQFFNKWLSLNQGNNVIHYDQWVQSKDYRDYICYLLNITNKDITNTVSAHGQGSSFVGIQLDSITNLLNRESQMDIPSHLKTKISEINNGIPLPVKAFCINLEYKEYKYINTLKELSKINIPVERYPVKKEVEGGCISRPDLPKHISYILNSHLNLLTHLLTKEDTYFLILEDDIKTMYQTDLNKVISSAPEDWDVILLGGLNHYKDHPPELIDQTFYRSIFAFNSHAYLIKKTFIPTLIKHLETRTHENDVIMAHMQINRIGNWYGLVNDLLIQDGLEAPSHISAYAESYTRIKKLNHKGIILTPLLNLPA